AFELNNKLGEILNEEWLTEGVYPNSKTSGEIAFLTRDENSKWNFMFNFYGNEQAAFIIKDVE
ncbi:MAG TPA: hypothetical protein VFD78_05740, partial [Chitinophagaceae bacterium]|nr:hypothetical protein [Chitinophagaceae bacterium]